MKVITVAIVKGGAGKTATALSIAQAAAYKGKRVLCVDLDPQGNLSYGIGADISHAGSLEALHGAPASVVIQSTPQGIDAITAAPELATEQTTAGSIGRLRSFLLAIEGNYDFVVIDTPPAIGETTYNAIAAASVLIIPMRAAPYDIAGMYHILNIADALEKTGAANISRRGIVITQHEERARINQHFRQEIEETAARFRIPILGIARRGVAIAEAAAFRKSLYETAPKSKPAADYMAIFDRIATGNGRK